MVLPAYGTILSKAASAKKARPCSAVPQIEEAWAFEAETEESYKDPEPQYSWAELVKDVCKSTWSM
jgi:hypothetical protein